MPGIDQISHGGPPLEKFYAKAAEDDRRVLTKGDEVKTASRLHKGHTFKVVSETVFKKEYPEYFQENIKANLDFLKALMRDEDPKVACLAYSLLEPAAKRGEPLTKRDILEVRDLASEIQNDTTSYEKRMQQFDTISRDPRMQICLETTYPGEMDGLGAKILEKAKEFGKGTGASMALNMLLPGVGTLVSVGRALHTAATNADAEAHHHQVQQVAVLPGRDGALAIKLGNAMIREHEKLATDAATTATLTTVAGGVSGFGVVAGPTVGVMPAVKEGIQGAVGGLAGKGVATAAGFVPTVAKKAINEGVDYLAEQGREHMQSVLPRLEISNEKGDFTFAMSDPASVKAFLLYLGPAENKALTAADAPDEVRKMELTRLELKEQLGSAPSENLVPGDPESSARPSDAVYHRFLNEDYNWLVPGVRAVDEGKADEINQRLTRNEPMAFDGRTVYLSKSPKLTDQEVADINRDGPPSLLRLMHMAEGWI